MRKRRMAAITLDPSLSLQISKEQHEQHKVPLVEEIEGLIRVYKDGHVERSQIVPSVTCAVAPEQDLISRDIIIDQSQNIWARFYVPKCHGKNPLLLYFHGGGFCVGSASWSCYHEFLAKLACKANCVIMSVNYRLAPENPLPAAYDDGFKALFWVKQQAVSAANEWFTAKCNLSSIFLAGDSAGANIAYNIATRLGSPGGAFEASGTLRPLGFKGAILIQPFFGGESRTYSEKYMVQPPRSALTLAASDTYWRLSLPAGANRDHPWCNPLAKGAPKLEDLRLLPTMVCVSEMDILKDRNLEVCAALVSAGKKVEHVVYKGVGHAFQILNKSQISLTRTDELVCQIKNFISRLIKETALQPRGFIFYKYGVEACQPRVFKVISILTQTAPSFKSDGCLKDMTCEGFFKAGSVLQGDAQLIKGMEQRVCMNIEDQVQEKIGICAYGMEFPKASQARFHHGVIQQGGLDEEGVFIQGAESHEAFEGVFLSQEIISQVSIPTPTPHHLVGHVT